MAFVFSTVVVCITWLITVILLCIYGFPKITKVSYHTELMQQPEDRGDYNPSGFAEADAAQEDARKQAILSDLASAVNSFIEGDV